jgi:hypothetical protein
MFLTDEEIVELTKKRRRVSQRQVLNALGIVHKVRPDGSLVVARDHALKEFGVAEDKKKQKEVAPNWGALAHA